MAEWLSELAAPKIDKPLPFLRGCLVDHPWYQECVDQQPQETDEQEIGRDLQKRCPRPAEIEAMAADEPRQKPEQIGRADALFSVGHALFDQDQVFGAESGHVLLLPA